MQLHVSSFKKIRQRLPDLRLILALQPFHKDSSGNFFSSNDVANIAKLGYTYPELQGNPSNATVKAAINALYYDVPPPSKLKRAEGSAMTYMAAIRAPMTVLNGSYTINVFLGEP